jgi:hypothetical protein
MAEDNAKPISLLITEDVAATLSRVKVEEGYHLSLTVERLNATNHEFNNPRHLLAVIDPGDIQREENPAEGEDEFTRVYTIHVWVIPSQTDGRPIDEYFDYVAADVVRNLCDDASGSYRRSSYVTDTRLDSVDVIGPDPNSLAYVVNVNIEVRFSVRARNLYQQ